MSEVQQIFAQGSSPLEGARGVSGFHDNAWALPTSSLVQCINPWAAVTIANSRDSKLPASTDRKDRGKQSWRDKGEKKPTTPALVRSDGFSKIPIGVLIVRHWPSKCTNIQCSLGRRLASLLQLDQSPACVAESLGDKIKAKAAVKKN